MIRHQFEPGKGCKNGLEHDLGAIFGLASPLAEGGPRLGPRGTGTLSARAIHDEHPLRPRPGRARTDAQQGSVPEARLQIFKRLIAAADEKVVGTQVAWIRSPR